MIGVFDSGSGGLTILRALEREIPSQLFLYLGDHRHAPYGDRSPTEIYYLTQQALDLLYGQGCSLVVIACNTAAATGLRQLQQTWLPVYHPSRRAIGVVIPVVEAITGTPWATTIKLPLVENVVRPPLRVAVFATTHTVQSRVYVDEIRSRAPHIEVTQKACPELVDLIERAAPREAIAEAVRGYVHGLIDECGVPDICILGCTHYPLIEDQFARQLPAGVKIFSQPDVVAKGLASYLVRHPEFASSCNPQQHRLLTTGNPDHVSAVATKFYGDTAIFHSARVHVDSPHG